MLLQDLLLALLLINCVALSSTQSCGTTQCSQEYDNTCPEDTTCHLYDNCQTTKSSCNVPIGPASNSTVDCYDTCIVGHPLNPTIPLKCCGNSISSQGTIALTSGENYLIARLYSLVESVTDDVYRSNSFCKYNVQCYDDSYSLHYTMINFNVEPPGVDGKCLDFLRYHFTSTGMAVDTDACGNLEDLPDVLKSGVHGSGLAVDFRTNRIKRDKGFFLALSCIQPSTGPGAGQNHDTSVAGESFSLRPSGKCTPSMSLEKKVVRDLNVHLESSDEDYLDTVFPNEAQSNDDETVYRTIAITQTGVVKYNHNTITVQEDESISKFKKIKMLQLYNRIEGYLTFNGSSSPRRRQFPGYGFLRIRKGFAQYYQTLVDPKNLLNEDEENIVRELYQELFNRQTLNTQGTTQQRLSERVNCRINELAELNSKSCTDIVRAAADLFLKEDTFQEFCKRDR